LKIEKLLKAKNYNDLLAHDNVDNLLVNSIKVKTSVVIFK